MNSFYEHHKDSINWHYRCFDRILLNGLIQPFQQPERGIADQFQRWVTERAEKRNIPIVEAPKGRRDEFIDPYFERAKPDAVVAILKAREPARIMIAIGDKVANRWHLQFAQRWVIQYNFYINDRNWGRMFVRVCPYLPFSARICLTQHHWLANRMRQHGIGFKQAANAFLKCAVPDRLQELANSLTPRDLVTCGQKWLAHLTPFFTAREREHAGCQHRLFFSQVEYCDNLIFHRRAALASPSIKIATNTPLFQRMEEDMDINCGTIVDGHETVQEAGQRIFERILRVASGERTKSEQYDVGSNEFAPWPIGATV